MLLTPNPTNCCFGCGGANPRGMQLTFEQDDEAKRIRGRFRLGEEYQGAKGFLHGGIIATLLDEVMAKVSRFAQDHAVTGELTVEYRKPVPIGEELIIEGWEVARDDRIRLREGEIRNASGVVLARGRGKFIEVNREKFRPSVTAGAEKSDGEKH
jgi:uncharacterized protein (TIGR00369 family)